MSEPTELRAGDLWEWTRTSVDYPASAWTLTYYLRASTHPPITIVASADGDDHAVSEAATATGEHPPAVYDWIARVDDGGTEVHTIDSGRLRVLPNLADANVDPRTFSQKALEALEEAMLDHAGRTHGSVSIEGRSISWQSWDDLERQHQRFKSQVAKELGIDVGRVFIRTARP